MTTKTQSILSYLGIFWVVAYFGGKDQRDEHSVYHLKQGLGLIVTSIALNIVVMLIISFAPAIGKLAFVVGIFFLSLMVLGIIHAANEVKKPLPVIGQFFEDKFPFIR